LAACPNANAMAIFAFGGVATYYSAPLVIGDFFKDQDLAD
jgi:hypothetical protein